MKYAFFKNLHRVMRITRGSASSFANERGSAILVAVGITGIIFTITMSLSVVILATFHSGASVNSGNKAFYAGEAAIEESLYMIAGHGPGFQYDSSDNTSDDLGPLSPLCDHTPYDNFPNKVTRSWIIDSRVSTVPETKLAAESSTTMNLHRDKTCPYEPQPIDPADDTKFKNLEADDFILNVYYKSTESPNPTDFVPDKVIALADLIQPVIAVDRPTTGNDVTITDDATEIYRSSGYERIDKQLQSVSNFRTSDENIEKPNDRQWELGEALYDDNLNDPPYCAGQCLVIESNPPNNHPVVPPASPKMPFAENVTTDSESLYTDPPPQTNLTTNLYIDSDGSGTVSTPLASRWKATAHNETTASDDGIQYDMDKYLAHDETNPVQFTINDTGNRAPDINTKISGLLDNNHNSASLSFLTYTVPMYYSISIGNNPSTAEPLPSSSITISAHGISGTSIQVLETSIEQVGTKPIFNRTQVF